MEFGSRNFAKNHFFQKTKFSNVIGSKVGSKFNRHFQSNVFKRNSNEFVRINGIWIQKFRGKLFFSENQNNGANIAKLRFFMFSR